MTDWKAPINSQVAHFDRATPGTLPLLNWQCVKLALRAAHMTKCTLAPKLVFDRKHYRHWDLPAGYQITQKRFPLGINGLIHLPDRDIRIKQIHIEQVTYRVYSYYKFILLRTRANLTLVVMAK